MHILLMAGKKWTVVVVVLSVQVAGSNGRKFVCVAHVAVPLYLWMTRWLANYFAGFSLGHGCSEVFTEALLLIYERMGSILLLHPKGRKEYVLLMPINWDCSFPFSSGGAQKQDSLGRSLLLHP